MTVNGITTVAATTTTLSNNSTVTTTNVFSNGVTATTPATELDDDNNKPSINGNGNHLCPPKWENNKPPTITSDSRTTTLASISIGGGGAVGEKCGDGNNNKNMSQLIRALSWPLISPNHTVCLDHAAAEQNGYRLAQGPVATSPTFQQLVAARRSLCRRYYPEGHWGWCILVVGAVVNILTHGLQLSYGVHLAPTARRFPEATLMGSGEFF